MNFAAYTYVCMHVPMYVVNIFFIHNSHEAPMNPEDLIWNGRARTVLYNYYNIYMYMQVYMYVNCHKCVHTPCSSASLAC